MTVETDETFTAKMRRRCSSCGERMGVFEKQTARNGVVHNRVTCAGCGRWAYFAPWGEAELARMVAGKQATA